MASNATKDWLIGELVLIPKHVARFWRHVGPRAEGCWLWMGPTIKGYGDFKYERKHILATRIAWVLAGHDALNAELKVCHKCDNPLCVNPEHLFLGTHSDNMKDSYRKGRTTMPDPANASRISWEQRRRRNG